LDGIRRRNISGHQLAGCADLNGVGWNFRTSALDVKQLAPEAGDWRFLRAQVAFAPTGLGWIALRISVSMVAVDGGGIHDSGVHL